MAANIIDGDGGRISQIQNFFKPVHTTGTAKCCPRATHPRRLLPAFSSHLPHQIGHIPQRRSAASGRTVASNYRRAPPPRWPPLRGKRGTAYEGWFTNNHRGINHEYQGLEQCFMCRGSLLQGKHPPTSTNWRISSILVITANHGLYGSDGPFLA